MYVTRTLVALGMTLVLLAAALGHTAAQSDDCPQFQNEITVLEARLSTTSGLLDAARAELAAIDAQLGVSTFDLLAGTATLDPTTATYDLTTANSLQRATMLVTTIAQTYDDFLLLQSTLALLRNACGVSGTSDPTTGSDPATTATDGVSGTTTTATGGVSGTLGQCINGVMVLENTVGAGGDEIVLVPCDVATGTDPGTDTAGGVSGTLGQCINGVMVLENTVGAGGDEIVLVPCGVATGTDSGTQPGGLPTTLANVPLPPDDPFDGWWLRIPGTLTYNYVNPADGDQGVQETSISFYLSDEGVLYDARLFFYHVCERQGTLTLTGNNTFNLDFTGILDGTSTYWRTNADVTILATTFNAEGYLPVSIPPAEVTAFYENEPPRITGTFVQSAEEPATLRRFDVSTYAGTRCGSGAVGAK